jgi:hypothetical protein
LGCVRFADFRKEASLAEALTEEILDQQRRDREGQTAEDPQKLDFFTQDVRDPEGKNKRDEKNDDRRPPRC